MFSRDTYEASVERATERARQREAMRRAGEPFLSELYELARLLVNRYNVSGWPVDSFLDQAYNIGNFRHWHPVVNLLQVNGPDWNGDIAEPMGQGQVWLTDRANFVSRTAGHDPNVEASVAFKLLGPRDLAGMCDVQSLINVLRSLLSRG